ncbi:MAG: KpsF/GutQ family sugar-phosphate isomerase [Alphaproteobacteria bacterium]|nr:KpsF/GutQ family sugar-phosphate isomerase [Alphaproteobacteria bacterium]
MEKEEIIAQGRHVLDMEADAIRKVSENLGDSFVAAVLQMFNTKGRIIVTGMGKSGHVGKKIAATLASVGTPAFFVHPAEASHGDLGMFTTDDTILALSYSGESKELADVIAFSRRFNIPLISMVGKADSTLAKSSDIVICYPPFEEACSFGMAPTTSTTVSLAVGDALAMTLLEMKGFSKEQYRLRHPGGKLGALLLKVRDLMAVGDELPLVGDDSLMSDSLVEMTKKKLGCVGVIDKEGHLIGMLTDGDLRRHICSDLLVHKTVDVMTKKPRVIEDENMLAVEAVRILNEKQITNIFVVKDNKPIGLLHLHQCLAAGVV